jgi:hypothetical protein
MIQWAPLDELYPPPKEVVSPTPPVYSLQGAQSQSECNIMVMMFIGGVLALALLDSVRG